MHVYIYISYDTNVSLDSYNEKLNIDKMMMFFIELS